MILISTRFNGKPFSNYLKKKCFLVTLLRYISPLISIIFLAGCNNLISNESLHSDTWNEFHSTEFGYSIQYPSTWEVREYIHGFKGDEQKVALLFPPNLTVGTINIRYKKIEQPTFEDLIHWENEIIQNSPLVYELQETKTVNLSNGMTIQKSTYIEDSNKLLFKHTQYVHIIRDDDAFIIELNSNNKYFDELLIDFERIVNSFGTIESE